MGGGDESLAGFCITQDKEKVLAINVQKESQVPYGVLMVLDQELNPMAISFESDYASHINDLIISGDSLFLSIDFDRFLSYSGSQEIFDSEYNATALMKFSNSLDQQWVKVFDANGAVELADIELTPNEDVIGLFEHEGEIEAFYNQTLLGNEDLSLARIDGGNGEVLWSKEISGDDNETQTQLLVNDYGSIKVLLKSESGIIIDGLELNGTSNDEFLLLEFDTDSKLEVIMDETLSLREGEFFTSELEVLNSNFAYYKLIDAPNWISLTEHDAGIANLSGTPVEGGTSGSIRFAAYGFDGEFSINQIEYTITENDDYSSTSRLPEFSEKPPDIWKWKNSGLKISFYRFNGSAW